MATKLFPLDTYYGTIDDTATNRAMLQAKIVERYDVAHAFDVPEAWTVETLLAFERALHGREDEPRRGADPAHQEE